MVQRVQRIRSYTYGYYEAQMHKSLTCWGNGETQCVCSLVNTGKEQEMTRQTWLKSQESGWKTLSKIIPRSKFL